MKKCLIIVTGWLGDSLFASSIAEKLIKENQFNEIDYLIGFPQTKELLENNPFINKVILSNNLGPYPSYNGNENYDKIFTLPVNDLIEKPTIKFQKYCGVKNPTDYYNIYTNSKREKQTLELFNKILFNGKKNIGICSTWKTINGDLFDPSNLIEKLKTEFNIFKLGMNNISQFDGANHIEEYNIQATLCKYLDWVVGSEGGLTNLAAGIGTNIIYTTDFTYSLFGPKGRMYQYNNPLERIGPKAFFPTKNHIALDQYINYDNIHNILKEIF